MHKSMPLLSPRLSPRKGTMSENMARNTITRTQHSHMLPDIDAKWCKKTHTLVPPPRALYQSKTPACPIMAFPGLVACILGKA